MLDFSDEEMEDIKANLAFIAGYQNAMDILEEEKLIEKIKEFVSADTQTQYDGEYWKGVEEVIQSSFKKMSGVVVDD